VYLGGDGTFNEVARGILASRRALPMGMLPMGTANDQGRSFGLRPGPEAVDENLDVIFRGHVTRLDAGKIEALDDAGRAVRETYFFDSAGFGMQPAILAVRNRDRAKVREVPVLREIYRDQVVYFGATLDRFVASFLEPTKFSARVVADGKTYEYEGLTDIILSGTSIYGGAWVLDRRSEPDDGKFELVPMQGRRDWASKALRDLSASVIRQEHLDLIGVTHSEGFSASTFDITLTHPGRDGIASQVDGEEWHIGSRYRVTVEANRLPLFTPADFVPPWR
jgi:diacylglycerol kinase family enzyme